MIRRLTKKWRVLLIVLGLAAAACIAVGLIMYALAEEQMGGKADGARLERMLVCPNFIEGKIRERLPTNMISPASASRWANVSWASTAIRTSRYRQRESPPVFLHKLLSEVCG